MRCEIGLDGCIWESYFLVKGCRRGSVMVSFERAMVVSYRLSIVITALSLKFC